MTLTWWILVGIGAYFLQSIVLAVGFAMLLRHLRRVDASEREVDAFEDAPLTRERRSPVRTTRDIPTKRRRSPSARHA